MAQVGGVGAKKLERYGAIFLAVINGEGEDMHPSRRRLAGREAGSLYDRLVAAQTALERGADGTEKPLSCSASLLAKLAEMPNADEAMLARLLGARRAERFGSVFLAVLRDE